MASKLNALLGAALLAFVADAGAAGTELGAWPLCEASGAATFGEGVLVVDNEQRKELYVFDLEAEGLTGMRRLPLGPADRVRDAEALVSIGYRLLVVGSHSRNRHCEAKSKRWRLQWLRVGEQGRVRDDGQVDSDALAEALGSVEDCLRGFFADPTVAGASAVCEALVHAESRPDSECRSLNIEGAVFVPESAGAGRIWFGLRSPLSRGRAILLRWAAAAERAGSLRFDAVATLDLAGSGVRELTLDRGVLWGIGGPSVDSSVGFELWGVDVAALQPGAALPRPQRLAPLPAFSEGLVIDGDRALVLSDGDLGDVDGECRGPSRQSSVPLPQRLVD